MSPKSLKLLMIDGNSIVNRAFYGVPLLTDSQGRYTNGVYGFMNIFFKLFDEEKPDYVGVAFDVHSPTFRHEMFSDYKGTRKGMPEELRGQMPILKEVLNAMNITCFEMAGYEADDILGTMAKIAEDKGMKAIVVSGDRDLLQVCSENIKVRIPKTIKGKTEVEDYGPAEVEEKYGVTPREFIEVKALMGDPGDNVPGVPNIGEKTAVKIIQQYGDIENAIVNAADIKPKKASENIAEYAEQARLSRKLVEIDLNVPVEYDFNKMDSNKDYSYEAYSLFKQLGFKSMLNRVKSETNEKKTDVLLLKGRDDLHNFINKLKGISAYSILCEGDKLAGIAFACSDVNAWAEVNSCLSEDELIDELKIYFGLDKYPKIALDSKSDMAFLRKIGCEYNGLQFDTSIAAYILNPMSSTYHYDDISGEYLGEEIKSEEEILGKGKSRRSIFELSDDEKQCIAVKRAEVAFLSQPVIDEKLSENGQHSLYYDIELPLIFVLADMEKEGIRVDRSALEVYQKGLEKSIDEVTAEIYALAGEEFNINSPKQLGVILFEKLGLKGGKKTKTGYSTAAEVLESLMADNPVVEKILYFRQLTKLKSTYADGLLAVMDKKTERIYSTFNQTITATGRISSTEPNLQNIPVRLELGRELRKVFIPKDGYLFVDADYSQIELRVLAHMADDKTLINAFKEGQDIHRLTASQVFNAAFDEVTSKQRSDAKTVNFGIIYGMGAFSLSKDLGITKKKAEEYISGYFAKYPNIKVYMDNTVTEASEKGYVTTIYGRRRPVPEINSGNFNQRAFGERVAMNMPIQGSAADIIKIAMINVYRRLKDEGLKSKLILQVHDELLIETAEEELNKVTEIIKKEMENAASLSVPLDVDVHSGKSWYEAK
ncbi:MAG: DNA polymerase I [Candidatus Metalachnospira sp.]|nr:DNA polymerase I [Candidatus Metalachnospira sp.]